MSDYLRRTSTTGRADNATAAVRSLPGKRTLVEHAYDGAAGPATTVQRRAVEAASGDADAHAAAARGVATPASALPHGDRIQQLFGRHDVSTIQAHVGPDATASATEMGAQAYATGNHVVLGDGGTDLFTQAHEAAHVVQQRGGVQLKGGVGEAGDPHERHADEVAARVVQGRSAEGLLDQVAGPAVVGAAGHGHAASGVQRRPASAAQVDITFNAYYRKEKAKPENRGKSDNEIIALALQRTRAQVGGGMPSGYVPPPLRGGAAATAASPDSSTNSSGGEPQSSEAQPAPNQSVAADEPQVCVAPPAAEAPQVCEAPPPELGPASQASSMGSDAARSVADHVARTALHEAALREMYFQGERAIADEAVRMRAAGQTEEAVARWSVEARNQLRRAIREEGEPIVDAIARASRGARDMPSYDGLRAAGRSDAQIIESAARSNAGVNRWVGRIRIAGRIMIAIDIGIAVYHVAQAPAVDRPRVMAREAGRMGGALGGGWAGAESGAYIGGGIGTFIEPVGGTAVGAAIGGFIGGVAGAIGGGMAGEAVADWAIDEFYPPANTHFEQ